MVIGMSMMDMVLTTFGVLITLALLSCLCCMWMKLSDHRMKCYLEELARTKGYNMDDVMLDPAKNRQAHVNDTCTIMVPNVGIVL